MYSYKISNQSHEAEDSLPAASLAPLAEPELPPPSRQLLNPMNIPGVRIAPVGSRDPRFARYHATTLHPWSQKTAPASVAPMSIDPARNILLQDMNFTKTPRIPKRKQVITFDVYSAGSYNSCLNKQKEPDRFHNKDLLEMPPKKIKEQHAQRNKMSGLDVLASIMPSKYALIQHTLNQSGKKLSNETTLSVDEHVPQNPENTNVHDLFAKLVATGIVQEPKASQKVVVKEARPKENDIHEVDLLRPETLRVKQPGLVAALYDGRQCSSCEVRFPHKDTLRYSQHLDWHYRQNKKQKDAKKQANRRPWHYNVSDWMEYEEVEDLEGREKSFFEAKKVQTSKLSSPLAEVSSVAASSSSECNCAVCGDSFQQFFNDEDEEWHLRNSVRHENRNYHPLCFEDYKVSLTKS